MKSQLTQLVKTGWQTIQSQGHFVDVPCPDIQIDRTRDKTHGDFSTNIALMLAKACEQPPRVIAQLLCDAMLTSALVSKIEVAGPGFINFFVNASAKAQVIRQVLTEKEDFGRSDLGQGTRVLLEYVSANPTGPLHVGHGRSAAYGASLANLLKIAGYDVSSEYYVNDAGRQMDILAASVWLRYLECCGESFTFPSNAYRGDYVKDIAQNLFAQVQKNYHVTIDTVLIDLPLDEPLGGDKEVYIDAMVERMRTRIGEEAYVYIHRYGLNVILDDIRDDLAEFGVVYQNWFSERSLIESGEVEEAIASLKKNDCLYEKDGALWFNATRFHDEKDRVLLRSNGSKTYFANDVAYHYDKYRRGYDRVIDIFGADHHGYMARIKASVEALGHSSDNFDIALVQFAILFRGKEKVSMSTRSGEFVTLRELRDEVGNDAARYFYVSRKAEQHMDFDLELAKSHTVNNPVYYIQYAHARVCSVMKQLTDKGFVFDQEIGLASLDRLTTSHEDELITVIARYPELVHAAAKSLEPHQIAHYLRDLATNFHTYYNAEKFIVDDAALRNARLSLCLAAKHVLCNGLMLLGVSAPQSM